jgi:hypothetical protein
VTSTSICSRCLEKKKHKHWHSVLTCPLLNVCESSELYMGRTLRKPFYKCCAIFILNFADILKSVFNKFGWYADVLYNVSFHQANSL